ncbi:protein phosphatase 1 regulatory subunit SDS22 [Phalaenopsis equestris]|uniref:protein phosphatase 1 regulatory subunit SDS22 n=1 Tax=Phalaenopsis equestris TaxID=78828 RepID=UPI0009E21D5E|nr:protein phosphatase 1 regulatory subunit SDS22 [Phalaenopsis equestris]XP_020581399.1 protein phosphatase 1 regulatory subunit SDS22 [Phalaenopsis equestris]
MTRLSMEQTLREKQNCEASSVTSLQLSHRALSDVYCLSNFQNLERLDLSYNCLTSLEGLSACANLKWLQVLENKLVTLKGIEGLSKLMVLNAGRNKLEKMDEICVLSNLRALILNDNNISSICKLDQMKYLNTLVLSRNPIYVIGNSLKKMTSITKLSLSHCKLQNIGPSLVGCVDLKEARFSYNEIAALPEELAKNINLQTLDVGNNLIEKFSEIKVLSALHNLKNLNLLGNPIVENDKLVKKVKTLVPNIRIFNAKPSGSSNMALKVSEKGTLRPTKTDSLQISFGVRDEEEMKKRESKKDDALKRKRLNASAEETHANDTLTGNVSVLKGTKKKSKSNTQYLEKKTDDQKRNSASVEENSDNKIEKKPEKKKGSVVKVAAKSKGIDDEDSPFVDLIFSGKAIEDIENERGRETLRDAKLDPQSKKAKRSKSMESGLSALKFFSLKHEIGMGGQSTWDY